MSNGGPFYIMNTAASKLWEALDDYAPTVADRMCHDPRFVADLSRVATIWMQGGTYDDFLGLLHAEFEEKYFMARDVLGDRLITPAEIMGTFGGRRPYEPRQLGMLADSIPSVMAGEFLIPQVPVPGNFNADNTWLIARLLDGTDVLLHEDERIATVDEARWVIESYHHVRGKWLIDKTSRVRVSGLDGSMVELIVSTQSPSLIEVKAHGTTSSLINHKTMVVSTS